jgi:hypothetical protein
MPLDKLDPKTVDRLWSRIMSNSRNPLQRSISFTALYLARYGATIPPKPQRSVSTTGILARGDMRSVRHHLAVLATDILRREREIRSLYVHEVDLAFTMYGDGDGVRVSGVFRNHFPDKVKARLRYLIRAVNGAQNFSFFLWIKSGRKGYTWRETRERVWEHGS